MRGGIDLGGTKIQTAVVDDAGEVKGEEREPTPTSGGPSDVAEAMAAAMRAARREGRRRHLRARRRGRGLPRDHRLPQGRGHERPQPPWLGGLLRAGPGAQRRAGHAGEAQERRGRGHRRRVRARRRPALPLAARRLLGHRRGRGDHPQGTSLGRARRRGRDRPRGGEDGRRHLPLRPPGLHGGLRRAQGAGGAGSPPPGEGPPHRPLQDHGEARPRPADERHLGPRARGTRTRWPPS